MIMMTAQLLEKKDKNRARNTSIVIHALLLLIAFFYFWTMDIKPVPKENVSTYVAIEFKESSLSKYAHADAGKKKAKTESTKKLETKQPKPVVTPPKPKVIVPVPKPVAKPTPTDPIVSKTTVDESPVVAVEEEMEIDIPEPEVIVEVVEEVEEEVITEEDLEELMEEEAEGEAEAIEAAETGGKSGDGGKDNTDSSIEGDGGKGEAGTGEGDGATSGDDGDEGVGDAGSGTGDYDGSGDGVFGRKIIKRNWRELFKGGNQSKGKGKIAVKICVDRAGDVRYTEILFDETTETDNQRLKQAMKAAKGYKVQEDPRAPTEQCGKLIFNLDINALKGN
jgi:outer membrane biosynthesis protein TonB|tara:strand:- start:122 stop:1129 length:1008 start_codon:yes stop_codon:yes gene_type:complete